MSPTLIALSGFYPAARHAAHYADMLAQALDARLVLLHVNRVSVFDPYELVGEAYRQEELDRQTDTAAALYRQAETLRTPAAIEITTDLLPAVAQDLAARYGPVLFVLGYPEPGHPTATDLAANCAELLRAGQYPLLLVPATTRPTGLPHHFVVAADQEPFQLTPAARALRRLLTTLGTTIVVAHVSGIEDDAGCGAALRAVQASGLTEGLPVPELRGYEQTDYAAGLLDAIRDTQADMVLLMARQRSYLSELFHQSVTARLLERSPVPLLLLPAQPDEAD
ncbi:universal stress protein [Microvirga sp. STR05]|uniref:Universal stress protein n=1 Tax=Hymenobacter duratus TaxID=2771356 RepID=A0ABR8JIE0_9BACT|nr:universal stress protein [Hymenobacter duratus]MBD2714554.1 universal stress protein [Hymenobacter duratus]MBR7949458.1 universal stress protein [Microvirga sp. STR05]